MNFSGIFRVVYRHAQNFGKENTLSAILASMFEFSPKAFLSVMDVAGVDAESSHRTIPISDAFQIETGVTYFCSETNESEEFRFRPDILVYAGDSFEFRGIHLYNLTARSLIEGDSDRCLAYNICLPKLNP